MYICIYSIDVRVSMRMNSTSQYLWKAALNDCTYENIYKCMCWVYFVYFYILPSVLCCVFVCIVIQEFAWPNSFYTEVYAYELWKKKMMMIINSNNISRMKRKKKNRNMYIVIYYLILVANVVSFYDFV